MDRWDETWHRLREWTTGPGPSERLAAQVLLFEGFAGMDPSHPLGGPDGGKDAWCLREGCRYAMAVYFPRGEKPFGDIRTKFRNDATAASDAGAEGLAFVTNQELTLGQREELRTALPDLQLELYHLERITAILDNPTMHSVRAQFLGIEAAPSGSGGRGGSGTIHGNRGTVVAGRGGRGGTGGPGGDGGGGEIHGDDGLIIAGDGGDAATPDGRGGRPAMGPMERANGPTELWKFGRGGAGANASEYDRRLGLLREIRGEYLAVFDDLAPFVEAGVDQVPVAWVNKRLEEKGEPWRVCRGTHGYELPALEQ